MEVRLDKRYPVAASAEQAWAVLADVRATAACMPGAQITEQLDGTHYKGSVKARVGPAVMSFSGDIEILALDAATRSMTMLGKGADKSGSSASMNLAAQVEPGDTADSCVLVGAATIVVSGKLAQFGSRLLVPVSDAMLAQFADNFRAAAAAQPAAAAGADHDASEASASEASAMAGTNAAAEPAAGLVAPALSAAAATTATAAADASGTPSALPPAGPARAPQPPAPVKELNALALMWTVLKGWLAGLFGRRG